MSGRATLAALFEPCSVAIVGASDSATSITGQPVRHLVDRGYAGGIYPVNAKFEQVHGLPCYPSVDALPEAPDLAVLVVSAARVPAELEACGRRGVRVAVIISGGFAELGEEGVALQSRIRDIARAHGMRVVGPNCQGMLNVAGNVCAGFGPVLSPDYGVPAGGVSFITQSGGFGFGLVNLAAQAGIGFRCIVSTGNEADLTAADFIAHFLEDPGTRIVAALLEGVNEGRRLRELGAASLAADKPLLVWKTGSSAAGRSAAASHTGTIAGDAAVCSAVLRQVGAVEIEDAGDFVDYACVFGSTKRPAGRRIAIFSASGGAGVLACDAAAKQGVALATLSEPCRAALAEVMPALGSLRNPIDVMGRIYDEPDRLRVALRALAADPGVDTVVVINPLRRGAGAAALARAIADIDATTGKPVLVSWAAHRGFAAEAYAILREARVPCFDTPVRCVRALGALTRYAEARRRQEARGTRAAAQSSAALAMLPELPPEGVLAEHAAKRLVAACGIRTTREHLARDLAAAKRCAAGLGYPVALKLQSAAIAHKTEAGVVRLGIADERGLVEAYVAIVGNAARYAPDAHVDGVLVQEMVAGGVETIVGVTRDAAFGPVVMFGLGGLYAEIFRDVAFRLPPLTREDALEMIAETRCHAILAGARGRPPADIAALADAIVALGALALELETRVTEIEINPLAVLPAGAGVVALDALAKTARTGIDPRGGGSCV